MIVYGIKNCTTVRNALKFLDENNIKYIFFDLKKEKICPKIIASWLEITTVEKILNKKSKAWKNLSPKIKNNLDININEIINLNSNIIKRPLFHFENKLIINGFNDEIKNILMLEC